MPLTKVSLDIVSTNVQERLLPEINTDNAGQAIILNSAGDSYEFSSDVGGSVFVTSPSLSGPVSGLLSDGTVYDYTVSGSQSIDPNASGGVTYYWSSTGGELASSGTSATLSFDISHQNTRQTLSVYAQDSEGNTSNVTDVLLGVGQIIPPSQVTLSIPSVILINTATLLDVNVGDNGGDPGLTYEWQSSFDSGLNWGTSGLSSSTIKTPEITTSTIGQSIKVRVKVSNSSGDTGYIESSPILSADLQDDADSQYIDTNTHVLSNVDYSATRISDSVIEVAGNDWSQGDLIKVNNSVDVIDSVSGTGPQQLTLTNETVSTDVTVQRLTIEYNVPQISQQGGQDPFLRIDLNVQFLRDNKISVTENAGDLVIAHGTSEQSPLLLNDNVIVSGDTDVLTTINNITHNGVPGSGDINAGTEDTFDTNSVEDIQVVVAGDNRVVAFYRNNVNIYATVGTVNGSDISWGTSVLIAGFMDFIGEATYIGNDQVIVAGNFSINGTARAILGTISGTTTTWQAPVVYDSNDTTTTTAITYIGNNKVVACCSRGIDHVSYVGTVSGNTLTFGAENLLVAQRAVKNEIIYIGNDTVVAGYQYTSTGRCTVMAGTISGDVISWGSPVETLPVFMTFFDLASVENNKFIVGHRNNAGVSSGMIGTVTGNSITLGSSYAWTGGVPNTISFTYIGNNKVVSTVILSAAAKYAIGTISGDVISWNTSVGIDFNDSCDTYLDTQYIGNDQLVAVYRKAGNGRGQVLTYDNMNYFTTISVPDTLPTNVSTVELLPVLLESDLNSGTPTYQNMTESYNVVDVNTVEVTSSLNGDSGDFADIKIVSNNSDFADHTINRIQADFSV